MRNIDWKATARSLQLMVRENMREDEWRLTIVFDTALPPGLGPKLASSRQSPDDAAQIAMFNDKFERAVLLAASLANHFIFERADVELITTGDEKDVPSGSGPDHLYRILNLLATLEPARKPDGPETTQHGRSLRKRLLRRIDRSGEDDIPRARANGGIAWRLLDEVPVLADERRFKVLITAARKGTIPAHIWRSAHVVFLDDL